MTRREPCRCGHLQAEHRDNGKGHVGRCQYRYGAFSDQPTVGEQCDCPRYRAKQEVVV